MLFASKCKENRGIEKLNLSDNKLGNEGVVYLSEALSVNNILKEIILKANDIGNEGAVALAEALQHNSSLTKLDLQGNRIKPQGAVSLSAILKVEIAEKLTLTRQTTPFNL